ncbi:hypothetical protein QFC21_002957 [Naganishia friedmannii]|uniref:Uncharacterized protein n=1 Tax=Naganishia friedmannii TaxID=89922 RepID=A0ACC2VUT5_9TREE|nr:hypothetical protein QFC21_002957 [Naganishia friedmannii]
MKALTCSNSRRHPLWDGIDFSPCFREKYLSNLLPLALVGIATLALAYVLIQRLVRPARPTIDLNERYDHSLQSQEPNGKVSLSAIEDRIIFSSVRDAVETSLRNGSPLNKEKIFVEKVGEWVGAIGALALFGMSLAQMITRHTVQIGRPVFYGYMVILALERILPAASKRRIPPTILPSLMLLFWPFELIMFRSVYISSNASHKDPAFILETALAGMYSLWAVIYINVGYRTRLDGVLKGMKAGRGNAAGTKSIIGKGTADEEEYVVRDNPAEPKSIMSRALFSHIIPIVLRHYYNPFQMKDTPAIREDDTPAVSLANWRLAYGNASQSDQHSNGQHSSEKTAKPVSPKQTKLAFKLLWHFRRLFALQAFVADRKSTDPTTDGKTPTHVAVFYVALMASGQILASISASQILNTGRRICIRMRSVIVAEIYCKALRRRNMSGKIAAAMPNPGAEADSGLAPPMLEDAAEGEKTANVDINITNLVGVDAFFIAVLVLTTPVQGWITQLFAKTQKKLLKATDARLEAATETLGAIKTIKFAAWEDKFIERLNKSRTHELAVLSTRFRVRVFSNVVTQVIPSLVTIITFAAYTLYYKQPLTSSVAFPALTLFSMLRTPLAAIQEMVTMSTNAFVSAGRVEDFLKVSETEKYNQLSTPANDSEPLIGFRNAVISHIHKDDIEAADKAANNGTEGASQVFRLRLPKLNFPPDALSVIVGPVGSGKTTLLNALLGEVNLISGKIFMIDDRGDKELCAVDPATGLSNSVAYCPQAPWLIGSTIKENIIFGHEFDTKRYETVIHACALERDLEIFEQGDATIVGEKGTVCSGGQKARIALARAFYSSAKTILLDDVLSAVDSHTARHLYNECLRGSLAHNRTIILVTHAVGLVLPGTAFAVMLDGGAVVGADTPATLQTQGLFAEENLADNGEDLVKHHKNGRETASGNAVHDVTIEDLEAHTAELEEVEEQAKKDKLVKKDDKVGKFFKSESQETGSIGWRVWKMYFSFLGTLPYWVLLITVFIGSQAAQIESNQWIRVWSNSISETRLVVRALQLFQDTTSALDTKDRSVYYLTVYIILNLVFGLLVAARTHSLFTASLRASRLLYGRLLRSLLGTRMRFWDSTPSGQILNRLSNDVQTVDQSAAEILMLFTQSCLATFAVIIVIIYATPAFAFVAIAICIMYTIIGTLYNTTSLAVKRVDSISKSPILNSFGEVSHGQTSIRAYADSARFTRDLLERLETNVRAFHLLWQTNRLLSIYCDIIGSLVLVFAAVFILTNDNLDAGAAGLSLSYALTFTDYVLWIVRLWAACEQNLTSVERLGESEDTPSDLALEPEELPGAIEPPAYWPSRDAGIDVDDLTCAYAPELGPVLKGVSFTVKAGERVGIVGRTGSGKSTLALSFFRFIEASSGSIRVDGLDISKLKLKTLRNRLTILPQEAQLFSGSIRDNLDPLRQHEDLELWEVLRQCGMASRNTPGASRIASQAVSRVGSVQSNLGQPDSVTDTATEVDERISIKSLDEMVAKGGANFSAGQRQLLALARGMLKLKYSPILVLDESTANLDYKTDEAIQEVLRENLTGVTTLCIAHRLKTVIGFDKILVLDHGHVLEYDTPYNLVKDNNSSFRDLCRRSGEEALLLRMAEQAEKNRAI